MKKYVNGEYVEITAEEIAHAEAEKAKHEREYWLTTPYEEAVNAEIRKRYSVSQEFAILRQRDEKPAEYAAYFAYCEDCKAYVKSQRAYYEEGGLTNG